MIKNTFQGPDKSDHTELGVDPLGRNTLSRMTLKSLLLIAPLQHHLIDGGTWYPQVTSKAGPRTCAARTRGHPDTDKEQALSGQENTKRPLIRSKGIRLAAPGTLPISHYGHLRHPSEIDVIDVLEYETIL